MRFAMSLTGYRLMSTQNRKCLRPLYGYWVDCYLVIYLQVNLISLFTFLGIVISF